MAFETRFRIRFHDADAAGILFHGNILHLAHNAFEEFLDHVGISWRDYFQNEKYAAPIRKAEIDFYKPLAVGESYSIKVSVAHVGNTSFSIHYRFLDEGRVAAEVKTIHVFVDPKTVTKLPIPKHIRSAFEIELRK